MRTVLLGDARVRARARADIEMTELYNDRTLKTFDDFKTHAPAIDPYHDSRKRWIANMYARVAAHMHAMSSESGLIMVHSWPDATLAARRKLVVVSENVGASDLSSEHLTGLAVQMATRCVEQLRAATNCSPTQRACYSIDLIERQAERAIITLTA